MRIFWPAVSFVVAAIVSAGPSHAQTLRFGLANDPDALDPTLSRLVTGRSVLTAMCDKLFDLGPDAKIVPQLATGWAISDDQKALTIKLRSDVRFHDGEKLDASAVKFSLERHLTMPGSQRHSEIAPIESVEVIDDLTVLVKLRMPFEPLLSQLTDRAGMIVSPRAARALGDKFATAPVCAGPYRFVERVPQDRIVLERFDDYWNKGAIQIERIEFRPIVDATVRVTNLRAGRLDIIERLSPNDVAQIERDSRLKVDHRRRVWRYRPDLQCVEIDAACNGPENT
jgi:peptide/nickel transport system substrate-binding protein